MNANDLFTAGSCNSAAELTLIMAAAEARMAPMWRHVERMNNDLLVLTFGRKVCARRARKLRRRGHAVVRLHSPTCNGKARFCWMPRLQFTLDTFGGATA